MKKIVCSLLLLCVGMETAFAADSGARRVKVARDDAARRSRSTSPAAKTRSLSKSPESGRKKWDKTPPPTITLKENIEGLVVFESEDRMDSESQNVAFLAGSVGMTVGSLDASGDGGDDGARGEDYQEEDISDDADGEGPNNSQSGGNRSWFKKKKKKDDEPVGASANPALPAYENVVNKVDDRLVVAGGIVSPGASVLLDAQRQDIQGAEGADGIVAPGYAVDEKAVVVGAALVEPQEGGNLPGDGAGNGIILPPIPGHPLPNVPALGEQLPGQHVGGLTLTLKLDQLARADQEEDHDQNGVVSPRDEDVEDGDSSDRTDLLEDKKPKEKKLIQAGVSRFSQALIGCVTAGLGYGVTALVHDCGGLPGLGIFVGGMTVPFVLKKTGIITKELDETQRAAAYGVLTGAGIYVGAHSTKNLPALRLPELKLPAFRFSDISQKAVVEFTENK